MGDKSQIQIFKAMENPGFYPHPVHRIEKRETHISKVFLTGEYVYKIKKPLDLGFLDFSTLEKRRFYCDREISLNRRLAHDIYLEVVAITLKNGDYGLDKEGRTVEYAVRMRQLPDDRSLQRMIKAGEINKNNMIELGRKLARFYLQAPESEGLEAGDAWRNVLDACEENFRQTKSFRDTLLDRETWETVQGATISFLKTHRSHFIHRFNAGKFRDCHGDLRTGHVYFTDKGIQIIDCIEFNDRLRHIDVINDLAFLLMDLDFHGEQALGNCLLNEFLEQTDDTNAILMMAFYKCYRAFVRCKINCIFLASNDLQPGEREKARRHALKYLDLSCQYAIQFSRPRIWVLCGMPATGKSTIAGALARILEIEPIRSDLVRKELFGLKPHERGGVNFGEKIYAPSAGSLTYGKLLCLAQEEIENGKSVILDATFSRAKHREDLVRLAKDKGIKPVFIECTAAEETVKERLQKRRSAPSVSDARLEHFDELKARYEPFIGDENARHIMVDTTLPLDACIRRILIRAFGKENKNQAKGGKDV
ncbi:MAG: AAA family ATPase [Desulfobacteraceae bacterium]|nr:AAA family ATPase [Desulfobacteraceae bacterium]